MIRVWRHGDTMRSGAIFQPVAKILKVRKGRPTVIEIDGERYVWMPRSMYRGPSRRKREGNRDDERNP